jgi:carboxylate-amine ligase
MTQLLAKAADVPDYTWFWWKMRPHPRLGTVEIRALDVQCTLQDLAGLVALVHCLARHEAEAAPVANSATPAEVLEEGSFRAARYGVRANLPDADGRLRPVSELLDAALAVARTHAGELGCEQELDSLPALLARGGGAGRQRAAYEIAGMDGLLRELTRLTGAGAPEPSSAL